MPILKFKNPLVIESGAGVTQSFSGELDGNVKQVNTISIGQEVELDSNVTFNEVTGSTKFIIGTPTNNLVLSHQSISGSSVKFYDGTLTIRDNHDHSGSLTVLGNVSYGKLETELTQSSLVYETGSHKFGDDSGDSHLFTGSVDITGSLGLLGQGFNEISNDSAFSDENSEAVVTEQAVVGFFSPTFETADWIRKKFAHTGSFVNSTTASFNAITSSVASGSTTLTATSKEDFMFFINGMVMENDAVTIQQSGSIMNLFINSTSLGYNIDNDDSIVAWGKFNS